MKHGAKNRSNTRKIVNNNDVHTHTHAHTHTHTHTHARMHAWGLTSTQTIRLIRDWEKGGMEVRGEERRFPAPSSKLCQNWLRH